MVTSRTRRLRAMIIAAAATVILPLAACGALEQGGSADGGSASGGSGPTIVTVPKLTGVSWFDRMEQGVDRYAGEKGADAYMQGSGKADANAQVRVIEDLISAGPDALAVVPFQPDAVEQVQARAMQNDIVVITHEAPEIKNADYDLEAFRNDEYGRNLMDELAKRMGEAGEYATMVGSLSSATHMAWVEAAIEHQKKTYPEMKHVGDIVETSDDSQIAYERMKELMAAHPNLKGLQGSASTDVVGAGQAVDEAGLEDEISVVGTSVPNDARAGLENGSIDLIAFWDPADAGYAMNALAQAVIEDKKIENGLDLGVDGYNSITVEGKVVYGDKAWITVTKDNVGDYDF